MCEELRIGENVSIQFLLRVSTLTRDIDIAILSVSVRLSVTRWYCMKTALHIVIVFSPYGSSIILFFYSFTSIKHASSRNSDGVTPCGAQIQVGYKKFRVFLPISRYFRKRYKISQISP